MTVSKEALPEKTMSETAVDDGSGGTKKDESLRELRARAMAQYDDIGESKQRMMRLNFLLEKSAAYASFISKRLETKREQKRSVPEIKPAKKKAPKRKRKAIEDEQPAEVAVPEEEEGAREIGGEAVSVRQPRAITGGVMREYQLEGMEWLASLYENGLNGILADEMGLGKTLQTIAFLCYLRERQVWGPFLILCPLSTLSNWASEFYRFAPDTPVLLYHGTPQERVQLRKRHLRRLDRSFPVVLTTYEISMRDKQALQRFAWKFIIVDEGHRLKDHGCRLVRDLRSYQSANRLLLTGTPLQNTLVELWALLNFLLPDIFNDLESFQAWFDLDDVADRSGTGRVVSEETSALVVQKLHLILQPFLLRRLKSDVEKYLPPKREYLLTCPMAPLQFQYYQAVRGGDLRGFLEGRFAEDASTQSTLVPNTPEPATPPTQTTKPGQARHDQLVAEAQRFLGLPSARAEGRGARTAKPKSYAEPKDSAPFDIPSDGDEETQTLVSAKPGTGEGVVRLRAAVQVRQLNLQFRLMQQRKVCQHPYLFDFPVKDPQDPGSEFLVDEGLVRSSGKLLVLDRLLPALFDRGHRVLIFSQFARVLDILEFFAELRGWQFCRIDGSVAQTDRQEEIVRFNTTPEIPLFLLTTRSGGLGINLTAADTVVIFDSDWNPQQDLQAQDRVHRIGQKRPVIIYRLVIAGSCEGPMLECAQNKRKLEKLVIHERRFKGAHTTEKVSAQDVRQILDADDAETVHKDQSLLQKVLGDLHDSDPVPLDAVLTEEELKLLLDRSPEAYRKKTDKSARFAQVHDTPDERNDMLAQMDTLE